MISLPSQRAKNWKKPAAIVAGILILFIVVLLVRFAQFYTHVNTGGTKPGVKPTAIPPDKQVFNILLLGYGGGSHQGTYLTDTLILVHLDIKANKSLIVSLPRDLWVRIPTQSGDEFHRKINAAYQMGLFSEDYPDLKKQFKNGEQGGADLLKTIVKDVTGMPIDYYVAIDFEGFKKTVDILGGIDINVERAFDDERYPIDGSEEDLCGVDPNDKAKIEELEKVATETPHLAYPCRYEKLHFGEGETHMNGELALKYVRSRYSEQEGGDFSRGRRQQLFLESVKNKVISIGFIPKIIPLLNELDDHVRTDIPLPITQKLIKEAYEGSSYQSKSIVLTTDNFLRNEYSQESGFTLIDKAGEDDWSTVRNGIRNLLRGITPTPTPHPIEDFR